MNAIALNELRLPQSTLSRCIPSSNKDANENGPLLSNK